ncbi:MAG: DUF3667 domain-containing protein, partial [Sphingomonas sp.]
MSGGFEAAGDIASGALLGRAIEPRAGEDGSHAGEHGLCLNCDTRLIGEFCHACGQGGHVHRSIASIGHDLLHGAFHFEGKIWRTVPMLLRHPGALTRRYIAGERARFVSPLALFLFIVFLMFATIHTFAGEFEVPENTPQTRQERIAKLDRNIASAQQALRRGQLKLSRNDNDGDGDDLIELRSSISHMRTTRVALATGKDVPEVSFFTGIKTGWASFDHGVDKANANPGLALYKLQSSAYKYSWALIPISVPFVALLFLWRRRYKLYDHTIFVTYSLSFMMLLATLLIVAGKLGAGAVFLSLTAMLIPPVHMFAQLRGAYSLGKFAALW